MKLSDLYWHRITPLHLLLWPISLLFGLFIRIRKLCYWLDFLTSIKLPVPVIVVDSITATDGGKTPLVLWLVDILQARGLRPGIIAQGNLDNPNKPEAVTISSNPTTASSKALLLARRLKNTCPIWVGGDPVAVGQAMLAANPGCNIIICINGLQYPRLERDFEVAVADFSEASFGNGLLLPAGPLRTSLKRLKSVDAVVINGKQTHHFDTSHWAQIYHMKLVGNTVYNLTDPENRQPVSVLKDKKLYAMGKYNNTQWFFDQLQHAGLQGDLRSFSEDHRFVKEDFSQIDAEAIIMPEEDAVQCHEFTTNNIWTLPLDAWIIGGLHELILNKLRARIDDAEAMNKADCPPCKDPH